MTMIRVIHRGAQDGSSINWLRNCFFPGIRLARRLALPRMCHKTSTGRAKLPLSRRRSCPPLSSLTANAHEEIDQKNENYHNHIITIMTDIIYIGVTAISFGVLALFTWACSKF
jgi:hypothetical protein